MIEFGIDQLLQHHPDWKKHRIGLVTNHAAVTNRGVPVRKALLEAGFHLVKLFSPEHGLDMLGPDGQWIPDGIDTLTSLPIISLYGNKLKPGSEDLGDLDLLLFDIPDIGSRFYTYLWTMTYLLEACAEYQKTLVILDRPNPISGNLSLAEGPFLESAAASFIGRWSIPIRHSCTLGELASYFNQERQLGCSLEIIPCHGWNRNDFQPDWGTSFQSTSPAIQSFESMLLYPGLCLLEATNLSEGRGTSYSFRMVGAPWIDGNLLASQFNQLGIDDVKAMAVRAIPISGKYIHNQVEGIEFQLIDTNSFQSIMVGLLLIYLIRSLYPSQFKWAPYPTQVNPSGHHHLDKLLGFLNSEKLFNLPLHQFLATITKLVRIGEWKEMMAPYLLYSS